MPILPGSEQLTPNENDESSTKKAVITAPTSPIAKLVSSERSWLSQWGIFNPSASRKDGQKTDRKEVKVSNDDGEENRKDPNLRKLDRSQFTSAACINVSSAELPADQTRDTEFSVWSWALRKRGGEKNAPSCPEGANSSKNEKRGRRELSIKEPASVKIHRNRVFSTPHGQGVTHSNELSMVRSKTEEQQKSSSRRSSMIVVQAHQPEPISVQQRVKRLETGLSNTQDRQLRSPPKKPIAKTPSLRAKRQETHPLTPRKSMASPRGGRIERATEPPPRHKINVLATAPAPKSRSECLSPFTKSPFDKTPMRSSSVTTKNPGKKLRKPVGPFKSALADCGNPNRSHPNQIPHVAVVNRKTEGSCQSSSTRVMLPVEKCRSRLTIKSSAQPFAKEVPADTQGPIALPAGLREDLSLCAEGGSAAVQPTRSEIGVFIPRPSRDRDFPDTITPPAKLSSVDRDFASIVWKPGSTKDPPGVRDGTGSFVQRVSSDRVPTPAFGDIPPESSPAIFCRQLKFETPNLDVSVKRAKGKPVTSPSQSFSAKAYALGEGLNSPESLSKKRKDSGIWNSVPTFSYWISTRLKDSTSPSNVSCPDSTPGEFPEPSSPCSAQWPPHDQGSKAMSNIISGTGAFVRKKLGLAPEKKHRGNLLEEYSALVVNNTGGLDIEIKFDEADVLGETGLVRGTESIKVWRYKKTELQTAGKKRKRSYTVASSSPQNAPPASDWRKKNPADIVEPDVSWACTDKAHFPETEGQNRETRGLDAEEGFTLVKPSHHTMCMLAGRTVKSASSKSGASKIGAIGCSRSRPGSGAVARMEYSDATHCPGINGNSWGETRRVSTTDLSSTECYHVRSSDDGSGQDSSFECDCDTPWESRQDSQFCDNRYTSTSSGGETQASSPFASFELANPPAAEGSGLISAGRGYVKELIYNPKTMSPSTRVGRQNLTDFAEISMVSHVSSVAESTAGPSTGLMLMTQAHRRLRPHRYQGSDLLHEILRSTSAARKEKSVSDNSNKSSKPNVESDKKRRKNPPGSLGTLCARYKLIQDAGCCDTPPLVTFRSTREGCMLSIPDGCNKPLSDMPGLQVADADIGSDVRRSAEAGGASPTAPSFLQTACGRTVQLDKSTTLNETRRRGRLHKKQADPISLKLHELVRQANFSSHTYSYVGGVLRGKRHGWGLIMNDERVLMEAQWNNGICDGWYILYHEFHVEFGRTTMHTRFGAHVLGDEETRVVPFSKKLRSCVKRSSSRHSKFSATPHAHRLEGSLSEELYRSTCEDRPPIRHSQSSEMNYDTQEPQTSFSGQLWPGSGASAMSHNSQHESSHIIRVVSPTPYIRNSVRAPLHHRTHRGSWGSSTKAKGRQMLLNEAATENAKVTPDGSRIGFAAQSDNITSTCIENANSDPDVSRGAAHSSHVMDLFENGHNDGKASSEHLIRNKPDGSVEDLSPFSSSGLCHRSFSAVIDTSTNDLISQSSLIHSLSSAFCLTTPKKAQSYDHGCARHKIPIRQKRSSSFFNSMERFKSPLNFEDTEPRRRRSTTDWSDSSVNFTAPPALTLNGKVCDGDLIQKLNQKLQSTCRTKSQLYAPDQTSLSSEPSSCFCATSLPMARDNSEHNQDSENTETRFVTLPTFSASLPALEQQSANKLTDGSFSAFDSTLDVTESKDEISNQPSSSSSNLTIPFSSLRPPAGSSMSSFFSSNFSDNSGSTCPAAYANSPCLSAPPFPKSLGQFDILPNRDELPGFDTSELTCDSPCRNAVSTHGSGKRRRKGRKTPRCDYPKIISVLRGHSFPPACGRISENVRAGADIYPTGAENPLAGGDQVSLVSRDDQPRAPSTPRPSVIKGDASFYISRRISMNFLPETLAATPDRIGRKAYGAKPFSNPKLCGRIISASNQRSDAASETLDVWKQLPKRQVDDKNKNDNPGCVNDGASLPESLRNLPRACPITLPTAGPLLRFATAPGLGGADRHQSLKVARQSIKTPNWLRAADFPKWTVDQLALFLSILGAHSEAAIFRRNGISGMVLHCLSAKKLHAIGIEDFSTRKFLLAVFRYLWETVDSSDPLEAPWLRSWRRGGVQKHKDLDARDVVLTRKLGAGGHASVYLGKMNKSNVPIAVKVFLLRRKLRFHNPYEFRDRNKRMSILTDPISKTVDVTEPYEAAAASTTDIKQHDTDINSDDEKIRTRETAAAKEMISPLESGVSGLSDTERETSAQSSPPYPALHSLDKFRYEPRPLRIRNHEACMNMLMTDHPNVVKYYGSVTVSDRAVGIAMEVCGRGSLDTIVFRQISGAKTKTAISRSDLIRVFEDVARGLAHIHDSGILHRDVKPSNFLVTDDGEGKVADLGIAVPYKFENIAAELLSVYGNIHYAAPEVLRREGFFPSSDVWSYGVSFWECVTNSLAYEGRSQGQIYTLVASGELQLQIPTSLPPAIYSLLKDTLEYDHRKRPGFKEVAKRLSEMRKSTNQNVVKSVEQFFGM